MTTLSIDQGTSGTKSLLLEDDGTVLARGFCSLTVSHNSQEIAECDPMELWSSIVKAVNQSLDGYVGLIDSVALANQGESVLAWNPNTHEPLSRVIVWQDSRATQLCIDRRDFDETIHSKTGLKNDPYFVAPKIRWLRSHLESLHSIGPSVITTLDTWIIAKLTGKFVTDVSTASRSLLMDLESREWDSELIKIWDLSTENLPAIIRNDSIVGEIHSRDLPQLSGVILAGVIVDQAAALLAQRCIFAGEAKCTYGTGAFLLTNVGAIAKVSGVGLAASVAWETKESLSYYEDGQVFTAASGVDWLIENDFLKSAKEIDLLPKSSNGIFSTSGFSGYGAPRWRPKGSVSISGITLASSKSEIARAVINGIAAQIAELINAIKVDGVNIKKLRVDGGLSQSSTLMQMQSNLSQLEIEVFPHPDATAIGAAILSRMALSPSLDLKQAIPVWTPSQTYVPEWSADQANEYMKIWSQVANSSIDQHDF
jgi:glycerol kinase